MTKLSKKEIALMLTPIIFGLLFVATVFIDHALFKSQVITARQAIGHEMLFFLIGFLATIIQLPIAIMWLFKKRWKSALLCIASAAVFWASIIFGALQGAAMFCAT